ncbi:MAG: ACT domain-containing protein [Thermoflexales bacterium]|nr:ACT domain-containing protein [Thermoflexales bacterium]
MTGVLSSIAAPLAEARINIFAISTFDTDYVLVKADRVTEAIGVLRRAGHVVE